MSREVSLSSSWGKSCVSWGLKYPSLQWCPKSRQWGWAIIPNQAATECVMSLRWAINLGNTLIAGGGVPTRVLRCEVLSRPHSSCRRSGLSVLVSTTGLLRQSIKTRPFSTGTYSSQCWRLEVPDHSASMVGTEPGLSLWPHTAEGARVLSGSLTPLSGWDPPHHFPTPLP